MRQFCDELERELTSKPGRIKELGMSVITLAIMAIITIIMCAIFEPVDNIASYDKHQVPRHDRMMWAQEQFLRGGK